MGTAPFRIVLLGPPGAGKGTQALIISKERNIPHISTGDILRQAVASGSPSGIRLKGIIDSGELVPDEFMIQLISERFSQADCKNGFLLDGFPRTVPQAQALDLLAQQLGTPLTHFVNIVVPENVLLERIRSRGEGRADDTSEVAANRLKVYWAQTAPVVQYYRNHGKLSEVDGLGSVEQVTARLQSAIGVGQA